MNGLNCFFEGLQLIFKPELWPYVIVPIIINALVLSAVIVWGVSQYDAWSASITGMLPDWLAFMSGFLSFLAALLVFVAMLYLFTIVANLIASPFNAILSVKVEERLTGRAPAGTSNLAVILFRSIGRELAKLLYYLPRLIGLVIITFIPGLNAAAPFLWVLFGAWMMTVQYADYAADNNEVAFSDLKDRMGQVRSQAVVFGLPVYFALAIPLLNIVLMPAAVAGGTVFWVEHLRQR